MLDTPLRFELRPSVALKWLNIAFIFCCMYAVWHAATPRIPIPYALCIVFAIALTLSYIAYRAHAQQPEKLEISAQGIMLWRRAKPPIGGLQVLDSAYWSGLMLSITVRSGTGRVRKILIPADALPAARLRELIVCCRHLARNCNSLL